MKMFAIGLVMLCGNAAFADDPCAVDKATEDGIVNCMSGGVCTAQEAIEARPRLHKAAEQAENDAGAKPAKAKADLMATAKAARKREQDNEATLEAEFAKLPGCQQAKLFAQYSKLPDAVMQVRDDARRAAYSVHCTEPDVLCLGTDGKRFNRQSAFSIAEGSKLTVRILSMDADDAKRYQVVLTVKHNLDSIALPQPMTPRALRAQQANLPAPLEYSVVASATSAAIGEKDAAIGFEVERRELETDTFAHVRSGRVEVDHGQYYFEFGLGVPFVYHDTRKATSATAISTSTDPRAAISVLYFPWGRQKSRLSYLGTAKRSFGIFAGTDFDFSTLEKDYHLGVAYSPIQGLGIAAGLSVIPVQFLADSSAMTTNGAINTSTHEVLRPFIGVFLTTDFLNTASQAKTALLAVGK